MKITYDPAKNDRNIRERGLSFDRAAEFDFDNALRSIDTRRDYGETRHVAMGPFEQRIHVLCFVETATGIRVISFRRANRREIRRYETAKAADG
ncbi:MAG TPA: BrnT family toxin [Stellaceae bacterium]|nr:BrnT family toxin [Stellaceae bacterium]